MTTNNALTKHNSSRKCKIVTIQTNLKLYYIILLIDFYQRMLEVNSAFIYPSFYRNLICELFNIKTDQL